MSNNNLEKEKKYEILSLVIKECLDRTSENKKNLENKAHKLLSLNIALLTILITVSSYIISNIFEEIENIKVNKEHLFEILKGYFGSIIYLISIFIMIFLCFYRCFSVIKVHIGVSIGDPQKIKNDVLNEEKTVEEIEDKVSSHLIKLSNTQKKENEKLGKTLNSGFLIFKFILFSISAGVFFIFSDIFFLKIIKKDIFIIKSNLVVCYITILIIKVRQYWRGNEKE